MEIQRINVYTDTRFSKKALKQHGCFAIGDDLFEFEIISDHEAVITGDNREYYDDLIEEFQFYAPHISTFYDSDRAIVKKFDRPEILKIALEDIQPSQFYVDRSKIDAISSFVEKKEDIIIQVIRHDDRYISLDGHTRLYYAVMKGFTQVRAVMAESSAYIYDFVAEAQRRGIYSPHDLIPLEHDEYDILWHKYCDDYFANREG